MTRPVFLAEDLSCVPSSLAVGERATLGGSEGRHAASVRRIGAGEWVDVVDGRGLRLICEVAGADKSSLSLVVREIVQEDAPLPEIILVQALAKGGRDEAAVEICTEIGIDRVIPRASRGRPLRSLAARTCPSLTRWQTAGSWPRGCVPSRTRPGWPSSVTRRPRSPWELPLHGCREMLRMGPCPRASP